MDRNKINMHFQDKLYTVINPVGEPEYFCLRRTQKECIEAFVSQMRGEWEKDWYSMGWLCVRADVSIKRVDYTALSVGDVLIFTHPTPFPRVSEHKEYNIYRKDEDKDSVEYWFFNDDGKPQTFNVKK